MRFVVVSERLDRVRGGIERHAAGLAAELQRRGHSVTNIRPEDLRRSDARESDWLVFDGVRRLALLRHARATGGKPRLALFSHGSFMEEAREDELRTTGAWRPPRAYWARRLFDRTLGQRIYRRLDRWFVLAEAESQEVQGLFSVESSRVTVLGLFVSREFLQAAGTSARPPSELGPYVCSISRIERRKNFGRFLEALGGTPYRWVLAGQDRGGLAELEATAARLPQSRWEYLGTVSEEEKVALMRGAEAVVVPSVLEGLPTIALEALVLGRPVLLAGMAYGPDGPTVIRCGPDAADLRAALGGLGNLPTPVPTPPPTVEEAVDRFLAAL